MRVVVMSDKVRKMESPPSNETAKLILREEIVVKKFEGDDKSRQPFEKITLIYENGQLIKREVKSGTD